jgi:DNA-binding transcriptional LysR family regulator
MTDSESRRSAHRGRTGYETLIDHGRIAGFGLNLFVAFDVIMRERNLTRAAQSMGLTQSAMSYKLRRLRTLFDDELFARTQKGVEPTPRAHELAKAVSLLLRAIQQQFFEPREFDPATVMRRFTIGMSDYLEVLLLPSLVNVIRATASGVSLEVRSIDQIYTTELLDSGQIDIGIGMIQKGGDLHRRRHLVRTVHGAMLPGKDWAVRRSGSRHLCRRIPRGLHCPRRQLPNSAGRIGATGAESPRHRDDTSPLRAAEPCAQNGSHGNGAGEHRRQLGALVRSQS